ncbi:MAG: HEAT repeat domain-containing protein [Myxococcales bacterium]|nr:HEAT repeat domain-containing protein [Myxococcales bacterium]
MRVFLQQSVLRHLGAIAVAGGIGLASPGASLLEIPTELVVEVVEETEEPGWQNEDRQRLLALVAEDQRVVVRARVAEVAGALGHETPDEAEGLLARLAGDASPRVRRSVSRGLESLLAHTDPMFRAGLVARWSTAEDASLREAIARSLGTRTPTLVTDMALSELCRDPEPRVRRAAVGALAPHYEEAPEEYARVAMRLVDDPDGLTRRIARRLVSRHA